MNTMDRARFSRDNLRKMKESGSPYRPLVTGELNPEWVEWLMGFPAGWTDCGD
jgi:hypothetical protein